MADAPLRLHRVSQGRRWQLFSRSCGSCERCGAPITRDNFHAAHLRAASHGGPPEIENLEAWCVSCNLTNGNCDVFVEPVSLREWQQDALDRVLEPLTMQRLSTVMAAPGAGKTLFAAAVFAKGLRAGLWNRMLVLVPRAPLVKQWQRALLPHISLDTHGHARRSGREFDQMDGVCNTYQALLQPRVLDAHRDTLLKCATLVVLDEVHHLGQPIRTDGQGGGTAWAKAIRDLVGDEATRLEARVLNLSGTLFVRHRLNAFRPFGTSKKLLKAAGNGFAQSRTMTSIQNSWSRKAFCAYRICTASVPRCSG